MGSPKPAPSKTNIRERCSYAVARPCSISGTQNQRFGIGSWYVKQLKAYVNYCEQWRLRATTLSNKVDIWRTRSGARSNFARSASAIVRASSSIRCWASSFNISWIVGLA